MFHTAGGPRCAGTAETPFGVHVGRKHLGPQCQSGQLPGCIGLRSALRTVTHRQRDSVAVGSRETTAGLDVADKVWLTKLFAPFRCARALWST